MPSDSISEYIFSRYAPDLLNISMLRMLIVLLTITHNHSYTMRLHMHFGYVALPQAPSYAPVKH